jgi:hypothetical protein
MNHQGVKFQPPQRGQISPAVDMLTYGGPMGQSEPDEQAGASRESPRARVVQRRKLAGAYAAEMCELPAGVWPRRALGSIVSQVMRVDDDPDLAEAIAQAWDLARGQPSPDEVVSRAGVDGRVVVAHGAVWSLVAQLGGPILLMSDEFGDVVRVDGDPDWAAELAELVVELVNVSQGLPAFDESRIPPAPRLPWHRPTG